MGSEQQMFFGYISMISDIVAVVTIFVIYGQLKVANKTFKLDGLIKLQEKIDQMRELEAKLYQSSITPKIYFHLGEFGNKKIKPSTILKDRKNIFEFLKNQENNKLIDIKYVKSQNEECEKIIACLKGEYSESDKSQYENYINIARSLINSLNDIGQLIEDNYIDKRAFWGKYHIKVLKLCHILEPVRICIQQVNGGNYGQRLLRMHYRALVHNTLSAKHRSVPVKLNLHNEKSQDLISAIDNLSWYELLLLSISRFLYLRFDILPRKIRHFDLMRSVTNDSTAE